MSVAIYAGWEAEGIDISEYAVSMARSKGLKVYQGTIESVNLGLERNQR